MRRAVAVREQRLGPTHPDTQGSQQSLAIIERRLSEDQGPPSREQQIAEVTQRAEAAVAQALAAGTVEQRAALAAQLEQVAQQAEANEPAGSPYLALAAHLRALKARLESHEPPEHAELRQRAEAAVAQALAAGTAEERAALAEKLRVAADAYAGGQPPSSPEQALALAEQLSQPEQP